MGTPLVIQPATPDIRRIDTALCAAVVCAICVTLCSEPLAKLVCLTAMLMLAGTWMAGRTLAVATVATSAAALFGLAFIATPYASITTGGPALLSWSAILLAGFVWVACVARPVAWPAMSLIPALPIIALAGVAWGTSLDAALSWRGDEDYLIDRVLHLVDALHASSAIGPGIVVVAAAIALMSLRGQRVPAALRVCFVFTAMAVLGGALAIENHDGGLDYDLRRYPYLTVWGHVVTSWFSGAWSQAVAIGPALHRVWPALAWVAMAGVVAVHLGTTDLARGSRALIVAALTTVPVALFYSTLVYIDSWAIVLMTLAAFNADRWIDGWLGDTLTGSAWCAAIAAMFIKETVLVFAAAILLVAAVHAVRRVMDGTAWSVVLGRWLRLAAALLIPLGLYLFFRAQGPVVHYGYQFSIGNFNQLRVYGVMAEAGTVLFGAIALPAVWGAVVLARRRPWLLVFCATLFAGYWLFFFGLHPRIRLPDGETLPKYAGYGRFMMYLLPPIIVCALHGLVDLWTRKVAWGAAATGAVLACNLLWAPLRFDGTRPAGWGCFVHDTEIHQYPYDALYAWVDVAYGAEPTTATVIGRRYTYAPGDRMYGRRHDLDLAVHERLLPHEKIVIGQPAATRAELEAEFDAAAATGTDLIFVHQPVWGAVWPDPATRAGYCLARAFDRHDYRIVAYARRPDRRFPPNRGPLIDDSRTMKISLVILTYNEIDGVQALYDRIPFDTVDEAFVVDGGSTDGTREFFVERGVRVLPQTSPGRGEAFRMAFEHAIGDALIFYSPDGNEDPGDIPRFRAPLEDGADVVIASRMMRGAHNEEDDQVLRWRKWANKSFTLLANLTWNRQAYVTDTINGFRAITRAAWTQLQLDGNGYTIEYQSSIRAFKLGLRIVEFPTHEGARIGGESYAYSIPTGLRFVRLYGSELFGGLKARRTTMTPVTP